MLHWNSKYSEIKWRLIPDRLLLKLTISLQEEVLESFLIIRLHCSFSLPSTRIGHLKVLHQPRSTSSNCRNSPKNSNSHLVCEAVMLVFGVFFFLVSCYKHLIIDAFTMQVISVLSTWSLTAGETMTQWARRTMNSGPEDKHVAQRSEFAPWNSIKYWWLLVPEWLNVTEVFIRELQWKRGHSYDFPFKNINIRIVLDTAGALFDRRRTAVFHIDAGVKRGKGRKGLCWAVSHEEVV